MADIAFTPKIPSMDILRKLEERNCIYWQLDPDYLSNIAYNMHTLADKDHAGELTTDVARRNVDEFLALTAPVGSADWLFLHKARAEVVSYANDILRHKRDFKEDMLEAIRDAQRDESQFQSSRMGGILASGLIKMLPLIGMSTLSSLMTFMLKGHVAAEVSQSTGIWAPTVFAGVATFVVGKIISDKLYHLRHARIRKRLGIEKTDAWYTYAQTRLEKTQMHMLKLHELWYDYTRIPYWVPVEESHISLIRDEIRLGQALDKKIAELDRPWLTFVKKAYSNLKPKIRLRKKRRSGDELDIPDFLTPRAGNHRAATEA